MAWPTRTPEDEAGLLGQNRREAVVVGDGVGEVGQPRDPGDQERDDAALRHQQVTGVAAFRRAERAHRVGDRLDPGQR